MKQISSRTQSSLGVLLGTFALSGMLEACSSAPPVIESDPLAESDEMADYAAADTLFTLAPEGLPGLAPERTDESLLDKILRSHPGLDDIDVLYQEGTERYLMRELDLAEENFFVLQERIVEARSSDPDSLALLYLDSIERKLGYFADILAEERFFSDSYAPIEQTLNEAFDSLRTRYGLPDFIMPVVAEEPSSLHSELLAIEAPEVDKWIKYFTGNGRDTYQKWLDRRAEIGHVIAEILADEELPPELIYLAMIESGLSARARSRAAAVGYWQFIRSTARNRGLVVNEWLDERRDIEKATRAACRHLKMLHGMFGRWSLAFAAYNAGEYRIQRAIGLQGDPDYWQLRLPRETREYVPKFIAAARLGADPELHGFTLTPQDTLRYDVITLDDAFSLDQVAVSAGVNETTIRNLNPQLIAHCTPPNMSAYSLRVPAGKGPQTMTAVAQIPEGDRLQWRKHRLAKGETLGQLARRYRTSTAAIMELNGISNPRRVRSGRVLTIPFPRGVVPPATIARASGNATVSGRHTVRRGDTLSSVARRYGTTVSKLRDLNNLSGNRIYAGQVLVLSKGNTRAAIKVNESSHDRTRYKVLQGDNLTTIGRRFGVTVSDLLGWNNLPANGRIRAGQMLDIWRPKN